MQRIPETVCEIIRALPQEGKRARARNTTHISLFPSFRNQAATMPLLRRNVKYATLDHP